MSKRNIIVFGKQTLPQSKNKKMRSNDILDLKLWMEDIDLGSYYHQLVKEGIKTPQNLALLVKDELLTISNKMGMTLTKRKEFFRAVKCISSNLVDYDEFAKKKY